MNAATSLPKLTVPGVLRPGEMLGDYQLLCPIAKGGMGQVWAACRESESRTDLVAIKTALPRLSGQSQPSSHFVMLFLDEARIATSIEHPNVCRTYELGQDREILFLAMEWIDGASLANLIAEMGPPRHLEYGMAAHIVAEACAGLHAVHELRDADGSPLSAVHRDATPQNILVSGAGEVKIVDFGVVQARGQLHQATLTGELRGKIAYLAPEQLLSTRVDRRADVFALGCVLYLATTGRRAFEAESAEATMLRIARGEYILPSRLIPDYPLKLEALIVRALSDEPDDRFQCADEMRRALDEFVRDSGRTITRADVAGMLQSTLGASIEERRCEIRRAQRLFEPQRAAQRGEKAAAPRCGADPACLPPSGKYRISFGPVPTPSLLPSARSMRSRLATIPDTDEQNLASADEPRLVLAGESDQAVVVGRKSKRASLDETTDWGPPGQPSCASAGRSEHWCTDETTPPDPGETTPPHPGETTPPDPGETAPPHPGERGMPRVCSPNRAHVRAIASARLGLFARAVAGAHRPTTTRKRSWRAIGAAQVLLLLVAGVALHETASSQVLETVRSRWIGEGTLNRRAQMAAGWSPDTADEAIITFPTVSSERGTRARPAELATITILLQASPHEALVSLDDGPGVSTPRAFLVPADRHLHVVTASAPGFSTLVGAIRFDESRTIDLDLTSQHGRRPSGPKRSGMTGLPRNPLNDRPASGPSGQSPRRARFLSL